MHPKLSGSAARGSRKVLCDGLAVPLSLSTMSDRLSLLVRSADERAAAASLLEEAAKLAGGRRGRGRSRPARRGRRSPSAPRGSGRSRSARRGRRSPSEPRGRGGSRPARRGHRSPSFSPSRSAPRRRSRTRVLRQCSRPRSPACVDLRSVKRSSQKAYVEVVPPSPSRERSAPLPAPVPPRRDGTGGDGEGEPAALTRERGARLAALMRLVPEPTVSRLLDLWRKGGLAERVDLGKVTELDHSTAHHSIAWHGMAEH